jgi:hypothetical protein
MCFFFSFLPATFWLVIGYFVLFLASRSEGPMATFGRVLSTWIFVISGSILLAGAYFTLSDMCSMEAWMRCVNM